MTRKLLFVLLLLSCYFVDAHGQALTFVHLSDIHVGSSTGADDLRRTVADINRNDSLQFVIISGDITEFGADNELALAKQILDSLHKPWHIIPGNHDGNWSESGANTFKKTFGSETFRFQAGKYVFLGTACGPNMHMGPGQIPRENIVWLDSTLQTINDSTPVIFVNHYPQDDALNNWYEAIDLLKKKNIQLILCGHGHSNHLLNFEGIPGIMGRSNLRAKDSVGGFNIVTIVHDSVFYRERIPLVTTRQPWVRIAIAKLPVERSTNRWPRPSYAVNDSFPQVTEKWVYHDKSDIGSGASTNGNLVFSSNSNGEIFALDFRNGKLVWKYATGGKVYAIPAVENGMVVAGSSDGYIYALSASSGKLKWKLATGKAVLAHPVIRQGIIYTGASDGHFRAIKLATGSLLWDFNGVAGFVIDRALIYNSHIYFGCWNNDFYCLELSTGVLRWKWNNGSSNRMFSPAACFPVATGGRIFLVAPDRYMTVLNAETGEVIWRKQDPAIRARESMGLSGDSSLVFVKTMEGSIHGISTTGTDMKSVWTSPLAMGYEICPTAIVEHHGVVLVPGQSGLTVAISRNNGAVLWKHKLSNGLVTQLLPVGQHQLLVTTMDGKITLLNYPATGG